MNKSQRDGKGDLFDGKFVIFDILVHNGKYLVNSTFEHRQELLDTLYNASPYDNFIDHVKGSCYRVRNLRSGFSQAYDTATNVGMYEGLVMKRPSGKLETGLREANNTGWQVKVRKATKNYEY
jgi:ATP-dependent DNA ligase